jgi:hypothetical protein
MTLEFSQIQDIILNNPNKQLITDARELANKLMTHVLGIGLDQAIKQSIYFENDDVYQNRKAGTISNKDLFARLLQREDMVFTAKGGTAFYEKLNEDQTKKFDAMLDSIRYGMSIRKWVKEFALKAYRTDPMSCLFVEVDKTGNAYPTYKSIQSIYDYQSTGRKFEYVVFLLTVGEAQSFGVKDDNFKNAKSTDMSAYYRVVDDAADYIVKKDNELVTEAVPAIKNRLGYCPGITSSNLIDFANPICFMSPLNDVVELADSYLHDRSIRNLFKKYSGFPKAYEPLLRCSTCIGTGLLGGGPCPDCTPPGATIGTGYKLKTKVSDIARFPIDKDMPDGEKLFGYVSPPKDTWDKMDSSLGDIENAIRDVYWGSYSRISTTGPTAGESLEETATKTLSDLQPIYARLNMTADWAEDTENALCDMIGKLTFGKTFKQSNRTYGRYYILETPDDLMEDYLNMKVKGASQSDLFDALNKYYHSLYQNDPVRLAIATKLINVEPFVHKTVAEVYTANPAKRDYVAKLYYSEWRATKNNTYLLNKTQQALIDDLYKYADQKITEAPELVTPPAAQVTEQNRTNA